MKGFKLDDNGDIVIKNNQISMIDGNELLQQTVKSVLGTNKGEWFLNENEGIFFKNIFGKTIDEDVIRNEILQGLLQVDSSFFISKFNIALDAATRNLKIEFAATNDNGDEVKGSEIYA